MAEKVTINQIAELCGVSKATVSYVLNGRSTPMKISNLTRRKIIDVCTQLGYKPDKTAQALSAMRKIPLQIVLLTPWLYAQHSDFMAQINSAFQRISMGEEIKLSYAHFEKNALYAHLNPEKYQKFDCVVIAGTSLSDDAFLSANAKLYPNIIVLNRYVEGVCSVYGNDYETTHRLASSVARAKQYDSYVLLIDGSDSYCRQQRIIALKNALKTERTTEVLLKEPLDRSGALSLYTNYKQGRTCFVFLVYAPASLFMVHLLRAGVEIPGDCGIFCFDNHTLLENYLPLRMTTVNPKLDEMVNTVYALAKATKNGEVPGSRQISGSICQGDTAKSVF